MTHQVVACECGKRYRVNVGQAGKRFRCKECQRPLVVPDEDPMAPEPPDIRAEVIPPAQIDRSLVGAQDTVAGNPGMLSVSLVRVLTCRWWLGVVVLLVVAASTAFCIYKEFPWWVGPGIGLLVGLWAVKDSYFSIKAKFHSGNLCAALVVSERPYRVAVLTDLSTGRGGPKLAIKVLGQPLGQMTGGPPRIGARLVAVAWYAGSAKNDHWDDFQPVVINCACNGPAQIARATASIDPEDWVLLHKVLPTLPPGKPGLYPLWQAR